MNTVPDFERNNWMVTISGRKMYICQPDPEQIDVEDIAHSLAFQCRYGGHCKAHYSVAQHSVIVADHLPEELKLAGLFHDAAEAYLQDMLRPTKGLFPFYRELEKRWEHAIGMALGIDPARFHHPLVKMHDNRAFVTEKRDVTNNRYDDGITAEIYSEKIQPWSNHYAKEMFMLKYKLISHHIPLE